MEHYICTGGCMGASDQPGTCSVQSCKHHEQALEVCSCTDDRHEGRQKPQEAEL